MEPTSTDDRRAIVLLAFGAAAGIALAGFGIARSGGNDIALPPDAVAVVNGQPIASEAFARFADAVATERRQELDAAARRRLLERMIDEELLLQRGVALGLARHEPTARRSIVAAVIASVAQDAGREEPDEDALRAFHAEHAERFTRAGRTAVDVAFVSLRERPDDEGWERAAEIARRTRAGSPFAEVRAELGDPPTAPLPGGPLPTETLRRYLGPTAALAAERLTPGEPSDPIRGLGGYHVLLVREHIAGEVASFEEVRTQVRGEYLRARDEASLRATLDALRADADIAVDEGRLGAR